VLEVSNGAEVVGKLPLQEEVKKAGRLHKIRRWIPLGSGPSDFYPLLMQPDSREEVAASWIEQLQQRYKDWDVLILDNIPESDPGLPVLQKALATLGPVERSVSNGFYSVNTAKTWDAYFEAVVKSRNKDLLKDLRKLEREGIRLDIERYRTNIFSQLQNLMTMYAGRRAAMGQTNSYTDPARQNFVREVLASREPQGGAELSILKDGAGNAWAFQLDWLDQGTRYHWNHAYNHDFKKYSPGKLLLYKMMEADFANPEMQSINHMRGMAGYKTTLADTSENLIMIKVNNPKSSRLRMLKAFKLLATYIRS
jgi:CelD/BcsL family acetyltransferase involved in cellulose biosynthesis